jgi:hypothetical protein
MYAAQIISLLGLALLNGSLSAIALFIACSGLQIARARFEERLLEGTFPDYSIYKRDVGGFIPRLDLSFFDALSCLYNLLFSPIVLSRCRRTISYTDTGSQTIRGQRKCQNGLCKGP